jgi:hypothetical protein
MPRSGRSVLISPTVVHFLDDHGALSDRGRGPRNRSRVLERYLDFYRAVLETADPRSDTFPESYYELTLSLLTEPWRLTADTIDVLHTYLTSRPRFEALARDAGIDSAAYEAALASLGYNQRLFLVNEAEKRHAPPRSHDEA